MSHQIRVLHFVEATGGGVLSVIVDSITELRSSCVDAFNFSIVYSDRAETPANIDALMPGVHCRKMSIGRRFFSFSDIAVAWKIARLSSTFDVVHCHSSRAGFIGRLSRLLGNRTRILYSPHCYAFLNRDFNALKRGFVWGAEWLLARIPGTMTVACGDSEFSLAVSLGGHSVLVRNGYEPEAYPRLCNRHSVVASGRDCLQKDPDLFLEIARRLPKAQFRWIGPLRNMPSATGWLSRSAASQEIASGEVFLITSLWEGLPVAGLEAMSAGIPIVARNTPGTRDLVEHGVNGFIFSNVDEAVEYVDLLCRDEDLRRTMGRCSRDRYEASFTRRNYRALISLYSAGGRESDRPAVVTSSVRSG